ncbi:LysR family transcriptional regulator [Companilactobacillus zhongbaensis]|uniref:LysR family transcriptional regulator n=1 Tax=Companilactobacillus zhongbaensis TaxID=2486009 RepID=UPI000F78A3E5|nr:LysR family transcriptional regulator [Companilactobacillus zhongbaensis]
MNIKDVQYFVKLTELKSYSDTAHFFSVSQPTITYAIKRMESEFDAELIIRKSYANSITLTPAGQQFLIHARKILRENNLIKKDLTRIKNDKLKMGFPPIISDYLIPQVFDQFKDRGLLSRIKPVRSGSKELLQQLYDGKIDISLLGTTSFPKAANFDFKIIKTHHFKIIASDQRKFNQPMSINELKNEDFLILDSSSVHQLIINGLIERYNVFTNVIYQTGDYKLLLDLVRQNKGISFIAETALQGEDGIQELEISDVDFPPFYLMLVYRASTRKGPVLQKVIDIFDSLGDETGD